jgi:hypothetical protein
MGQILGLNLFQARNAYQSIFGDSAGYSATSGYYSNFFGNNAGFEATSKFSNSLVEMLVG